MSSSSQSDTPYKSRLLNFLNRQYIRINDQVEQKTRLVKSAVKIGIQTLLYPIYFFTQGVRFIDKNFKNTAKVNQPQLTESTESNFTNLLEVDQPIKAFFQAISSTKIAESLPQITIQGIAMMLSNHHLVLVNSDNEIFDIFSEEEQKNFQLLIRDLRGNYWEQKIIFTQTQHELNSSFPKIYAPSAHHNFFLYLFWQLMRWIQQGEVAIALNVFDESKFISVSKSEEIRLINKSQSVPKLPEILAKIDDSIANIENRNLFNSTHLNLAEKNEEESLDFTKDNQEFINENEHQKLTIQLLIRLAIDYFFGAQKNQVQFTGETLEVLPVKDTSKLNEFYQESISNNHNVICEISQTTTPVIENKTNQVLSKLPKSRKPVKSLNNKIVLSALSNEEELKPNKDNDLELKPNNEHENEVLSQEEITLNQGTKLPNDPFQIQHLILAAIDYFFNEKKASLSTSNASDLPNYKNLTIHQITNNPQRENWLNWQDLYDNNISQESINILPAESKEEIVPLVIAKPESENLKLESKISEIQPNNTVSIVSEISVIEHTNNHDKSQLNQSNSQAKLNQNLSQNAPNSNIITSVKTDKTTENFAQTSEYEYEEDYLEIKAINLGYDKHFLQIILELLDKIILWLEDLLIKIWHSLKNFGNKNSNSTKIKDGKN